MRRINDRLILGLLAGLAANLIKETIGEVGVRSGLTSYTCRRMIPLIFLNKKDAKTWKGWVIGTSADMSVAGMIGVLICYTLSLTGRDYGFLKGVMISNGILDQIFNAFARVLPRVRKEPNSNLLCKVIHTVFGIATVFLINALGDPALFGRKPLFTTGERQKNAALANPAK